uniref:Cytochrome c biogenesis protein CcsA n=1 Tax=Pyramimonas parkeae TaxID=36894 RepID=C0JX71_9CHLO|nr:heme attachment to plastid cytochrome c [Pyramimonas parkeae]ACJ71073.1 heme attachment to plastid cytochrome c [Pyramimonas parkeae]
MILLKIENLLGNFSFGFFFLTMLAYWFRAAFFVQSKTIGKWLKQFGFLGILIANFASAGLLICRWILSGHFPLSNLYESLIFLGWALSFVQILLEKNVSTEENFIGVIFSPVLLFISGFAALSLPTQMQEITPLIPALKSNWLMMHVSIMMLSYATLLAGSLMAFVFLLISKGDSKQSGISMTLLLDQLSYRTLGIGFPLLTLGILSGAVWANEAWGSYWSWDPKETWALITWFIFAIYLHLRITYGWQGKKPAIIASLGFLFIWICYLGVNLFGSGLHSYGWFSR